MDTVVLNHRNTQASAHSAMPKVTVQNSMHSAVAQSSATRIITQERPSSAVAYYKTSKATARSSAVSSLDYNMLYNKPSIGGVELHAGLQVIDIIEPGANIEIEGHTVSAPELTAAQIAALLTDD